MSAPVRAPIEFIEQLIKSLSKIRSRMRSSRLHDADRRALEHFLQAREALRRFESSSELSTGPWLT